MQRQQLTQRSEEKAKRAARRLFFGLYFGVVFLYALVAVLVDSVRWRVDVRRWQRRLKKEDRDIADIEEERP